jgi:transposase
MTLITGGERHRRWSDEDRFRILAAIEEPGAVVAEVARRADVCTSLVYRWRRQARRARNTPGFAKVIIEDAAPVAVQTSDAERGVILVEMKDARVRIGANASPALIASALKALRS